MKETLKLSKSQSDSKSAKYQALVKQINACKLCKRPKYSYPLLQGSHKSKVFVVSQSPSSHVYQYGQKWKDNLSGKRLREWFGIGDESFYNVEKLYLTSIGKCFPGKDKKGKDLLPDTICAEKWLMNEIELVQPELIITVGGFSFKWFFPELPFMQSLDGSLLDWKGVGVIPLPHPSGANISNVKKLDMDKILENLKSLLVELI